MARHPGVVPHQHQHGGAEHGGVEQFLAGAFERVRDGSGERRSFRPRPRRRAYPAVLMLMWHNLVARHGRELTAEMTAVGAAVTAGQRPMTALAVVVGLAVLREGSEVVLFLYGILATGTSASALFIGGVLGLAAGAAFTALTYYGLISIPARHIFTVTTVLIRVARRAWRPRRCSSSTPPA